MTLSRFTMGNKYFALLLFLFEITKAEENCPNPNPLNAFELETHKKVMCEPYLEENADGVTPADAHCKIACYNMQSDFVNGLVHKPCLMVAVREDTDGHICSFYDQLCKTYDTVHSNMVFRLRPGCVAMP